MADRYKIYEKLGAGGVGAVFRAYDSQLKRWVAVKRLLSANEAAEDRTIATELRREADTLASLRNPNVVTIFDVASDAEGLFMVMELLQGEDLADVVARGPLPYDDFKELASQTLEGLLSAHQHHILHRDIKPENIKVERLPGGRMQAKIIDFGLARAGLRARKQTEDQDGAVMGSIFYMAPEQLTRQPVDERTDLYSLGCVFYEALSGKKAFDGESMAQVIDKHINHDLVPLHVIAPHVPQWLDAWCMRLMAQKPEERPTSAQQAIEEFRAWEKMPQMVPYMPFMGMYPGYAQPMIYPGTGAVAVPGSGAVPLGTGYFPVAEPQPVVAYAQPVLEAPPATELAAITAPLAPAPAPPQRRTGGTPAIPAQRAAAVQMAAARPRAPRLTKKTLALMGVGALALILIACWLLAGAFSGRGAGSTGANVMSAILDPAPAPVSFQLPQDRIYPPADRNLVLFFAGNTGSLTSKKGPDGKPARANSNEPVTAWHDLSERGNDNLLRMARNNLAHAPRLIDWPVAKSGAGPKAGRKVLDFRVRDGMPSGLELADPKDQVRSFPFGGEAVLGEAGISILAVTQADAARLPTRIMSLGNDQNTHVVVRVDDKKNLVAEFQQGATGTKIITRDVNACAPCVWSVVWKPSGSIEFRAKDADGRTFAGKATAEAPKSALIRGNIGQVLTPDGKSSAKPAEQFNGYLAELLVYASALTLDQVQLAESRLRDHYIQGGASPVKERLKTKLPWVEPRQSWKLTTSHKPGDAPKAVDANQGTRWATGEAMRGGEWFQVELPADTDLAGLAMDSQATPQDYPRKFNIEVSTDGRTWQPAAIAQEGKTPLIEIVFPTPKRGKFIKITQTGSAGSHWGFHELVIFKK